MDTYSVDWWEINVCFGKEEFGDVGQSHHFCIIVTDPIQILQQSSLSGRKINEQWFSSLAICLSVMLHEVPTALCKDPMHTNTRQTCCSFLVFIPIPGQPFLLCTEARTSFCGHVKFFYKGTYLLQSYQQMSYQCHYLLFLRSILGANHLLRHNLRLGGFP